MRSDAFRAAAEAKDFAAVEELFAADVTFRSPVVYKPYEGLDALKVLLGAVVQVFEDFRYIEQVETGDAAVLVFEARVGDRELQGVDILRFGEDGRITEMMVMVRPMSGLHALAEAMAERTRRRALGRLPRPLGYLEPGVTQVEIEKVGVLGCGLMGHGIAQICAQAGWDVVVREVDQDKLDEGIGKIEKQLGRAVEKGKLEQADAEAIRGRITGTLDYADLADCDLVIEAITEDLDGKLEMWREVDAVVKDGAFFATNTSSLSVADQAAATGRPERFLGLHFFNPAQVMPLLEVVRAETDGDEAYDLGFELGEKLGKTTVAAGDNRGFIVNRLLVPYMLDAIRGLEQGVGSIEDIDPGMMAGASHPMGPLTLSDFVGLDTLASIADVMLDSYGEDRFAAPQTLRKLVEAGHFGRKTGRGFYDYSGEKPVAVEPGA